MARNPRKRHVEPVQIDPPISADGGLRVGIYHRVSTLDQDPTLARRELEAWAARQGGAVALTEEESASGAWNGRSALQRVLDAARKGKLDVVAVWKLDRFGRSALDVLANIKGLTDAGVRFVAVDQGLDVKPNGDAMSQLMLTVLAAVAEFERALIRDRTILGLKKAKRAGRKLGRPRKNGPSTEAVRAARKRGMTWDAIATEYKCSVGLARDRARGM